MTVGALWLKRYAWAVAFVAGTVCAEPTGHKTPSSADARGRPLEHVSLLVNPAKFDPVALLRGLDKDQCLPDRILVQVLDCGETVFATQSKVFRLASGLTGKDRLGDVAEWAHDRNLECWAALDLLRWLPIKEPQAFNPFKKHPDLEAGNPVGTTSQIPEGKFASPFNPKARQALVDLVKELVTKYPDLDGLLLCCRLPSNWTLGFDEPSRAAYIRHRQIDPIDLYLYGSHPEEKDPEVREYYNWRLNTVGELIGELASAFRERATLGSGAKVAVIGRGDFYDGTLKHQARTCDDWLTWAVKGYVDEVVIEAIWKDETAPQAWESATKLLGKCQRKLPLTAWLTTRALYKQYNLMKGWTFFREHGEGVQRIIIDPYYDRCVGDAKVILRAATATQ